MGSDEEWLEGTEAWVGRTGGRPFHATECESSPDDPGLYADVVAVLGGSQLAGFSIALDLIAFRELFGETVRHAAYYKCFADLVTTMARAARQWNEGEGESNPIQLDFTFDSRQAEGTAGLLYSTIRDLPEWLDTGLFETKVAFEGRSNPRIQMADLFAREAMKEMDRIVSGSTEAERPTMTEGQC